MPKIIAAKKQTILAIEIGFKKLDLFIYVSAENAKHGRRDLSLRPKFRINNKK